MLTLVVKALPKITDIGVNYTQSDLEDFVMERFLPGQSDDDAAAALMLRMEGKLNEITAGSQCSHASSHLSIDSVYEHVETNWDDELPFSVLQSPHVHYDDARASKHSVSI
ncbi:hypothetical protein PsorP6_005265 [Peronosclerospora sorghi]|uniref:Uncharacterized protein n=1 Tax=Peronosclerospora sorghi TaxID=230839 RepID=A0ACC0W216_9STRA|nr:hypothetical protein PsorP6_005265 [Peronosclerospora sorghi]